MLLRYIPFFQGHQTDADSKEHHLWLEFKCTPTICAGCHCDKMNIILTGGRNITIPYVENGKIKEQWNWNLAGLSDQAEVAILIKIFCKHPSKYNIGIKANIWT